MKYRINVMVDAFDADYYAVIEVVGQGNGHTITTKTYKKKESACGAAWQICKTLGLEVETVENNQRRMAL